MVPAPGLSVAVPVGIKFELAEVADGVGTSGGGRTADTGTICLGGANVAFEFNLFTLGAAGTLGALGAAVAQADPTGKPFVVDSNGLCG